MEIVLTCPLGSECEEARDGKLYRCRLYEEMEGNNPQNGQRVNEWRCTFNWQTMLMLQGNAMTQGVAAAVESHRNEDVEIKKTALQLIISDKKALS